MHKITLPSLPASMNNLYQIMFSLRKVELRPEVRLWKNNMKEFIPPWKEERSDDTRYWISMSFFGNWLTKTGKVRKVDHCNMEKVVIDVVCEKLGFDDSFIFEKRLSRKVQADEEMIEIELGVIQ